MKWRERALRKKAKHIMSLIRQYAELERCKDVDAREQLVLAFGENFDKFLVAYPGDDMETFAIVCATLLYEPGEAMHEWVVRWTWLHVMEIRSQAAELKMIGVAS